MVKVLVRVKIIHVVSVVNRNIFSVRFVSYFLKVNILKTQSTPINKGVFINMSKKYYFSKKEYL